MLRLLDLIRFIRVIKITGLLWLVVVTCGYNKEVIERHNLCCASQKHQRICNTRGRMVRDVAAMTAGLLSYNTSKVTRNISVTRIIRA